MPTRIRLLVDATQYTCWPATSGVQRVLGMLAAEWPEGDIEARYGVVDDGHYVTGPIALLGEAIHAAFQGSGSSADAVRAELRRGADEVVQLGHLEQSFDCYLLPEPTLQPETILVARDLVESRPSTTFFVYYDSLPLTHPDLFPAQADGKLVVTRYHNLVARSNNVAFISEHARGEFERRLARRTLANARVVHPGADALPPLGAGSSHGATFTMIGTVEPRKRYGAVLDAFEEMWAEGREYTLIVLGAPGWEQPSLLERLRRHARTSRVHWIEQPDDNTMSDALGRSLALLFPSDLEGYGLPPLESLAAGCPVIVSEGVPALQDLPSTGQIRLSGRTVDEIRAAIETRADPSTNARFRQAIGTLRLPTWRQFASEVEQWILETTLASGGRQAA